MALFLSQSIGFTPTALIIALRIYEELVKNSLCEPFRDLKKKDKKNSMSMVPFVLVHHYFVLIL